MAKRRKAATAKKSANKSSKRRAKRSTAGQKRKTSGRKPQPMTLLEHFLSLFAESGTSKKK